MTRRANHTVLWGLAAAAAASAGVCVSLALSGCGAVEKTADFLAGATAGTPESDMLRGVARAAESMKDYSPSQEHYIGRSVAAEILSRYKVHGDKALQEYVNLVGLAVLAAPEAAKTFSGYHFVVLEGQEVQAVSTPGGFVFLTEGAIRKAKDEDELASVLAHEIAHVTLKHGIQSIRAATRKQSAALLAQGAGGIASDAASQGTAQQKQLADLTRLFGGAIQDITTDLLVKGYSRQSEADADKLAAQILQSSGYARGALASYLGGLDQSSAGGKGGWLATHPSPQERIASLGELAQGSSPGEPIRRERFRKLIPG
jgi:predicted Zn-dependent protease